MKRFACILLLLTAFLTALVYADGEKEGKRGWKDRGRDLVGLVLSAKDQVVAAKDEGMSRFSLRESLVNIIDDYKEQYKEEGRAYARELGDTLVERMRDDPKIASTMTLVQVFCWVVIVYLTLVTIFMVSAVRRMHRDNARILALLEKQGGEH